MSSRMGMEAVKDIKRPALIYLGGKWKLAPWLLGHFPQHRIYVEPFGGGASVLLRKPRSHSEVYNDLNDDLVHLFKLLLDPALSLQLIEQVRLTPFSRIEFIEAYRQTEEPVERARRLLIRSFMGHGTNSVISPHLNGFRSRQGSSGATPAASWGRYPEQLAHICARLQGVAIEHRDALEVIRQHDSPQTLFYVDPPYVEATRSYKLTRAKTFYPHELDDTGHERLAALLHSLQGMVVLSGYACELYDRLYPTWKRRSKRHLAHGSKRVMERIWINPAAVAARKAA